MPSSKGYVRNYVEEDKTAKARGEEGTGHESGSAQRSRFRRAAIKRGLVKKGEDLDHRVPLSKGGTDDLSNARAEAPGINRSFPRNPDGSMKANHPKSKALAKKQPK
jgi:hypothetical protein